MFEYLVKYHITPRVVRADETQVICVCGLDESSAFDDEVDYVVKIFQKDGWGYKENEELKLSGRNQPTVIKCRSTNGVIKFEHYFAGETEWKINIARADVNSHIPEKNIKYGWPWVTDRLLQGFDFYIYSLNKDLYAKRPFRGDLHMHTFGSDGAESPAMMSAQYRKFGYDFISITDHYTMKPSSEAIKAFKNIKTSFKIFPGEEVHPVVGGIFHVVNFNGKSSVNDLAYANEEKTREWVKKIADSLDIENENLRMEIAWYKWICDEIRKTGGIAIYPHPYWVIIDSLNVNEKTSMEIYKRKLCDVVEMFGGTDEKHNLMQAQLYYDMKEKGYDFPVVASSDAHASLVHGDLHFDIAWTVVLSEDADKIPENILAKNTVAVTNFDPAHRNVYGDLRLVKYAWFLLDNYFERHDELCNASGQAILRYILGDETQGKLIEMLENELEKFNCEFFGGVK